MKIGKEFKPDPALKRLYYFYAGLFLLPFLPFLLVMLLVAPPIVNMFILLPPVALFALAMLWIPVYYDSISYIVGKKELVTKRGVWFKKTSIVPYGKITNIDILQGPLARALGVSTLRVQTAGYSMPSGPTAEIRLEGIKDPEEVRKAIMKFVK